MGYLKKFYFFRLNPNWFLGRKIFIVGRGRVGGGTAVLFTHRAKLFYNGRAWWLFFIFLGGGRGEKKKTAFGGF